MATSTSLSADTPRRTGGYVQATMRPTGVLTRPTNTAVKNTPAPPTVLHCAHLSHPRLNGPRISGSRLLIYSITSRWCKGKWSAKVMPTPDGNHSLHDTYQNGGWNGLCCMPQDCNMPYTCSGPPTAPPLELGLEHPPDTRAQKAQTTPCTHSPHCTTHQADIQTMSCTVLRPEFAPLSRPAFSLPCRTLCALALKFLR